MQTIDEKDEKNLEAAKAQDTELDFILWLFLGNSELPTSWTPGDTFATYLLPEMDVDGSNSIGFQLFQSLCYTVFDLKIERHTVITSVADHLHKEYAKLPTDPQDPNYFKTKLQRYRRYYQGYQDLFEKMDAQIEIMLIKSYKGSQMLASEQSKELAAAWGLEAPSPETISNMRIGYLTHILDKYASYKG